MTMARILIIEDNPDFVAFVCAVLELNGHEVTHTSSLHDGIALTQQAPDPDLVLLDLDLPDGNGLEFFEQVVSDMPVLAMTASTEADLARQLQASGARYLIKPVSARDLLNVVNSSLTEGDAHDATAHPHRR
jgi:two-component system KDP operon response regulator KdpE